MNLKFRLFITLLGLSLSVQASAQDGRFLSALDLAIQNFNADGSQPIKSWGPEHRFMLDVLKAVEANVPGLEGSVSQSAVSSSEKFTALETKLNLKEASPEAVENLKAQVRELADGCGYSKTTTTEEQNLGFSSASTNSVVTTTYNLGDNDRSKNKCSNPVTDELTKLGMTQLVVVETQRTYRQELSVSLKYGTNIWQDMRYVKSQLLGVANINTKFIESLNTPEASPMIGVSSDITLVNSSGKASLQDPVTLKYFKGSGDCPAGCIQRTYTTVEVTPQADGTFSVKVLSQDGNEPVESATSINL